jgi:hypothetical protein
MGDMWRLVVKQVGEGGDRTSADSSAIGSWSVIAAAGDVPTIRSGHSLVALGDDIFLLFGGVGYGNRFRDWFLCFVLCVWTRLRVCFFQA